MPKGKAHQLTRSVAVDTREQSPWEWGEDVRRERRALRSGDYTLIDRDGSLLDQLVVIERKSLADFVGCVGRSRARFERELQRLAEGCLHPFIFVEGDMRDVVNQVYPGRIVPRQIVGSVYGWSLDYGVHVHFLSSWALAAAAARRLFLVFEKRLDRGDIKVPKEQCTVHPRALIFPERSINSD